MDHHNRFREVIEADEVVLGGRAATFSPTVVEIAGQIGLDFVWLDFEHTGPSPTDSTVFEHLTRAAEAGGTELLVRLPSGKPSTIRKVLDAGVRNILVPRVDSAEEVRTAVRATRYVYDGEPGERGLAGGRAREWGTATDYVEREDGSVCLGVMIEKATALANLEEILAVPELGFAFVGPSDLSVQLGHPGETDHPAVREQFDAAETACLEAGVPLAGIAHDPDGAIEAVERGCQIVRIGGDLEAFRATMNDRLDRINDAI